MGAMYRGSVAFEVECDMIDASSLHCPDPGWVCVDANGHEHRWVFGQDGAASTPSLVWVKDGEEWWEDDDEPHDIGHLECAQCGERVVPGRRAERRYVAGLRTYRINGESVSEDEFKSRWDSADG